LLQIPPTHRNRKERYEMRIEGLTRGTRLVTSSGDIVELLEIEPDGTTARVRYVEVLGDTQLGSEETISADDIATLSGARFVGPT
jgi:hypothetical protein